MEYSNESRDRLKKIQDLKDAGVICYANNFHGKQDLSFLENESPKDLDDLLAGKLRNTYQTAGRIISLKSHGKLAFAKIRDHTGTFQICFMKDVIRFDTGREILENITLAGEEKSAYKIAEKYLQVGDYV